MTFKIFKITVGDFGIDLTLVDTVDHPTEKQMSLGFREKYGTNHLFAEDKPVRANWWVRSPISSSQERLRTPFYHPMLKDLDLGYDFHHMPTLPDNL